MKDYRFDALMAASRPENHKANASFTDRVMASIQSSEILSAHVRKMNVTKKETFMMKVRHLPKFAIVAIAIGALLMLSTGAYAAYQLLWPKPQVDVSAPTTSVSGRKEVAISFSQCGNTNMAQRYELKRNATITEGQIAGVVKAQCELQAIDSWARATFPNNDTEPPKGLAEGTSYDRITLSTSMATHIKSRDGRSITFAGMTQHGQNDETLQISDKVRYIADGVDVAASGMKENDPVVYITSDTIHMTPAPGCNEEGCNISGTPVGKELVAVVKLSMPFEDYDQSAWQSLTERVACIGNEADTCLSGSASSIDLYMNTSLSSQGGIVKEIQGVVTKIEGASLTIRSSSGSLFTVETTSNIIADYNSNRASGYNNQKVEVGSSLMVRYYEKESEHGKKIASDKVMWVTLQLEMVSKGDALKGY